MKHFNRLLIYVGGLFLLATGVVVASKSALGVSPVSSVPLALSQITGYSFGMWTTAVFLFYVFLQVLILRSRYRLKNLLQAAFGVVFGYFVDLAGILLQSVAVEGYGPRLALVLMSILLIAVGVLFIISMDIVPAAAEGLILAIVDVTGKPFGTLKVWFDSLSVLVAMTLSLVFVRDIGAVREGTVLSALLIGKVIGVIAKPIKPWLIRAAFYEMAPSAEKSI